jgi:hypothetical protein
MATFVANNMNNNGFRGEGSRRDEEASRAEAGDKKPIVLEVRGSSETLDGAGGKRKYSRAFATDAGADNYDDARYGQHIGDKFFTTNYGHGVYISDTARLMSTFAARTGGIIYTQREMNEWREFYRANRNLFNV